MHAQVKIDGTTKHTTTAADFVDGVCPWCSPGVPRKLLGCTQRRKELDKEATRAKRGAYQAYDDEEFEGEIGPGAKRKVTKT